MENKTLGKIAYSIDDAAKICGIKRTRIYAEIKLGRLRAKKCGSRTLITRAAIREWLGLLPDVENGSN